MKEFDSESDLGSVTLSDLETSSHASRTSTEVQQDIGDTHRILHEMSEQLEAKDSDLLTQEGYRKADHALTMLAAAIKYDIKHSFKQRAEQNRNRPRAWTL